VTDERLSKQQQERIDARQADRLAASPEHASGDAPADSAAGETGVVISHLRREIEVMPMGADAESVRCFLRATVPPVVTGDRVLFEREAGEDRARGVIVAQLPRSSLLSRHTPRGLRPVCANLDLLLITIASEPAPHADLVDRYLLAAELDELDAVIVVNKHDRLDDAGRDALEALLAPWIALAIPVFRVSAHSGLGLDALRAALAGRTAAFVGQSGVGKSSLINALVPAAAAETGTLSTKLNRGRGRGRHTTSTTRLYRAGDAVIVDSPGIREFAPDVPDEATLVRGFPEIAAAALGCRFRDCAHEVEPDCAVRAALASGAIAAARMASFRTLRGALLNPPNH